MVSPISRTLTDMSAAQSSNVALLILINLLLILINAFFAAAEIALISINEVRMKILADQDDRLQFDTILLTVLEDGQRVRVTVVPAPEMESLE